MKPPSWLADTIARRFALTEILVVGATLGMVFLFNNLSGVWAKEPLEQSGLLHEIADIVRIIEAAPPPMRPSLAAAAGSGSKRVRWIPPATDAAAFLDAIKGQDEGIARIVAAETHHTAVVLQEPRPKDRPAELELSPQGLPEYTMAVRLLDRSWVVLSSPIRTWGLPQTFRWLIRMLFLAFSISVFTVLAARRFAGPIKDLATAVRGFGVNPQAPAIPESGPREIRQVIRTFNEMKAQIQKFVSYRTMMLAAISHDLRTPLTRMRLRGELIEDADQQARLFRDVDEMQTMVDGALAFFRDDAVSEPTTTFDLANVLTTITNDYADQKIKIRYEGPMHAVCEGRPFALKRAFSNLVENAIKYATPPTIELLRESNSYIVVIRDRGPGIPADALANVFLPYYRVEKSRNRNTGGVGLGLTAAQAIVQGHGGDIALSNCVHGGLEARIALPLMTPFPDGNIASREQQSGHSPGKTAR
ncbi:MAG: integral rane sensor signal transduction histidine kinase [Gammaproteobacteria bacterium]|nr:integral rane sensor signal transduction histidine kinase [Gammaproteobacteria bacterium]